MTGLPASDGAWAIGSIVGTVLIIIGLAVAVLSAIMFLRARRRDDGDLVFLWFWPPVLGLLLAIIIAIVMWPYSPQYHQWRQVSGTVSEVEARLLGSGEGGMSEMFVVRFEESGAPYRVDDSRGALVEEGDTLTIFCRQVWEYQAADGQECRWGSLEEGGDQ